MTHYAVLVNKDHQGLTVNFFKFLKQFIIVQQNFKVHQESLERTGRQVKGLDQQDRQEKMLNYTIVYCLFHHNARVKLRQDQWVPRVIKKIGKYF